MAVDFKIGKDVSAWMKIYKRDHDRQLGRTNDDDERDLRGSSKKGRIVILYGRDTERGRD